MDLSHRSPHSFYTDAVCARRPHTGGQCVFAPRVVSPGWGSRNRKIHMLVLLPQAQMLGGHQGGASRRKSSEILVVSLCSRVYLSLGTDFYSYFFCQPWRIYQEVLKPGTRGGDNPPLPLSLLLNTGRTQGRAFTRWSLSLCQHRRTPRKAMSGNGNSS